MREGCRSLATAARHVSSFTIGIDAPDVIRKKVVEAEHYPILKVKVGTADDKINMQALREVITHMSAALQRDGSI